MSTVEKVVWSESSITLILKETIYKTIGIQGTSHTKEERKVIDQEHYVSKYITFLCHLARHLGIL